MILSHQQTDNVFVFVFIAECNVDHFYQPNTRFCFCLVCWQPLKKNNWDQWRHSTPISECRFQISYVFQRWFEFSLQNSRFKKKTLKKKTIFLIDCDVVSIWSIESNFISNTNIGQMWKNYSGIVICLKYFFKTINVNFNFWNNSFLGFSFRNIGSWSEK